MTYRILRGDVLSFARHYHGPLFHACLCDPPYHLTSIVKRFSSPSELDYEVARSNPHRRTSSGFMGSHWDGGTLAFEPETWAAFSELLYPGAFLMAFASSRGWHRMACAIEDAGFILHPTIFLWSFGSGFPKATNISKQIDGNIGKLRVDWEGHRYGLQALKPAVEPIIVAQKPYVGRPIDNITKTGAGALNIDAGRIRTNPNIDDSRLGGKGKFRTDKAAKNVYSGGYSGEDIRSSPLGRWPANLILQHSNRCQCVGEKQIDGYAINRFTDGAKPFGGGAGHEYTTEQIPDETVAEWECVPECPVRRLGEQSGERIPGANNGNAKVGEQSNGAIPSLRRGNLIRRNDSGTASRFFYNSSWEYEQQEPDWNIEVEERLLESDPVRYESKASTAERNYGLPERCNHPTVKPLSLCRHLASLLIPPDRYAPRRLFVPFSGVSSEMIGALLAGWDEIIGVEGEADYAKIGRTRLAWWEQRMKETGLIEPKAILKAKNKSTTRKNGKKKDDNPSLF